MFRKFFRWLLRLGKSAAASTEAINTLSTAKPDNIATTQEQVQEEQFFTQSNNLLAEFQAAPIPIYSSNLDNNDIVGYMVDEKMYSVKGELISQGEDDKDELLADDVSFLTDAGLKERLLNPKNNKTFILKQSPKEQIAQYEKQLQEEQREKSIEEKADEERIKKAQEKADSEFPEYQSIWHSTGDE